MPGLITNAREVPYPGLSRPRGCLTGIFHFGLVSSRNNFVLRHFRRLDGIRDQILAGFFCLFCFNFEEGGGGGR